MHSRLARTSEGSDEVSIPEGSEVLAPPVEFLPPYIAISIPLDFPGPGFGPESEEGPAGLTFDEAIAQLNADAEE